ncbi:MAG: hypothetical protein JXB32_10880 [Deltaproteobacteria bacterium]|nr:hypothetical protein [Deltaproteobacteria bacterium]
MARRKRWFGTGLVLLAAAILSTGCVVEEEGNLDPGLPGWWLFCDWTGSVQLDAFGIAQGIRIERDGLLTYAEADWDAGTLTDYPPPFARFTRARDEVVECQVLSPDAICDVTGYLLTTVTSSTGRVSPLLLLTCSRPRLMRSSCPHSLTHSV